MQNIKRIILISLCFIIVLPSSFAFEKQGLNARLQAAINEIRKDNNIPGMALSVSLPGEKMTRDFVSGVKVKNNKNNLINTGSLFQIGSDTKSFTAVLTLQLVAEGILKLDEPLDKWFPEYKYWQRITIRQLLNHSSGIFNYTESEKFMKMMAKQPNKQWSAKALADFAYQEQPSKQNKLDRKTHLYFPPGKGFHYDNTGYVLLGMIISKVRNKPFAEVINNRLLGSENYNMLNTYYITGTILAPLRSRMAHGYNTKGNEYIKAGRDVTFDSLSWMNAAGALVSNSRDLVLWARLIFLQRILPKQQLEDMMTLVHVQGDKAGETIAGLCSEGYGLGVGRRLSEYGPFWNHVGGSVGYQAAFAWLPGADIAIAITMTNRNGDATNFIKKIFRAILGDTTLTNPCKNMQGKKHTW